MSKVQNVQLVHFSKLNEMKKNHIYPPINKILFGIVFEISVVVWFVLFDLLSEGLL